MRKAPQTTKNRILWKHDDEDDDGDDDDGDEGSEEVCDEGDILFLKMLR